MDHRSALGWIPVLLLGVALGIASQASDGLPRILSWVGNLAGVWLLFAFWIGTRQRSAHRAAASAALALCVAALAHYLPLRIWHNGIGPSIFRWPLPTWILLGLVLGSAWGLLGNLARQHRQLVFVTSVVVGSLLGEAVYLLAAGKQNAFPVAIPLELLAAGCILVRLPRTTDEKRQALIGTVTSSLLFVVLLSIVVAVVQRVY